MQIKRTNVGEFLKHKGEAAGNRAKLISDQIISVMIIKIKMSLMMITKMKMTTIMDQGTLEPG